MFRPSRFRGRTREPLSLAILSLLRKTSDQHKCLRSALTEAYVDKRVAGKKGSIIDTALPLQARNQMLRGMDWWTFGGADASIASTWFGLRHARLKVVVLQRTVVSRSGCFVFEIWVLRFRVLRFRNYRILISETLFTFPVKRFMQDLIHSMILSRFHVKDSSLVFSKKLQ